MSTLTASQIASLLRQQGFAPEKIPTMTAISLAESSGNPRAFNPNASTGDKSYGLFQVNMLGGLGPARMKEFGLSKEEELFDPTVNARAAKKILESQGLGAWSVYKGGQYKQFLPEAQKAFSSLGQQPEPQKPSAGRIFNIYLQDGEDESGLGSSFLRNFISKNLLPGGGQQSDPSSSIAAILNQSYYPTNL